MKTTIMVLSTFLFFVKSAPTQLLEIDYKEAVEFTEQDFSEQIKKELNKYKPGQAIEFKLPFIYQVKSNHTFTSIVLIDYDHWERFGLPDYDTFASMKDTIEFDYVVVVENDEFWGYKYMETATFINLIEVYNCTLITYFYPRRLGLFRIGKIVKSLKP